MERQVDGDKPAGCLQQLDSAEELGKSASVATEISLHVLLETLKYDHYEEKT